MRIAWLGTGLMGRPMAARLLGAGHDLAVWNRTAAHAAPLVEQGAKLAATPAAAVAAAEVVFTMLRDGRVTRAALFGEPTPELAGRTVVQMGTISPEESRELARDVVIDGGRYLEAPLLGSIPQATAGELLVFAGGDAALFDELRPLVAPLASELRRVGGLGDAATLKIAFNQLIGALATGFCLSLAMVRHAGIDVELFMEILRRSAFYTVSFDGRLRRYLERDYANPNFPLALLLKDAELALAEATRLDLGTEAAAGVRALLARGVDAGLGALDYGALYEAIDPPR